MLILYSTEYGKTQIQLHANDQTVWLSQREMAQLFDIGTDNVGRHLKNLYDDPELRREGIAEESSVVQIEGGREVRRPVTLYNLNANQRRKKQEALAADQADEPELESLQAKLKRRSKRTENPSS